MNERPVSHGVFGLFAGLLAGLGLRVPVVSEARRGRLRARPHSRPTDLRLRLIARSGRWRYVRALVPRLPGREVGAPRPSTRRARQAAARLAAWHGRP